MKKPKQQILYIHGGTTFPTKKDYLDFLKKRPVSIDKKEKWDQAYLDEKLGRQFDIIRPRMPRKDGATYSEWEIHFRRLIPLLKNNVILIGQSLGGIFLAKYLSENKFPKKIKAVFLVAPPFDDTLSAEKLAGGFKLKKDLSLIEKNCQNVFLLFSKNDQVVPVAHAEKYAKKLPESKVIVYTAVKGHFQIARFPQIVKLIRDQKK